MAEPASRPFLIEKYTETRAHGYYRQIGRLLALSRRIYGERLLGGAALARCLQIAYLYPLVALLIGWVIWNAGTLGGLPVLPEGMVWEERAWRAAALVLIGAVEFAIFRFVFTIPERVEKMLTPMREKLDQRAGFLAKAARWSGAVAVAVAGAFAVAGAGAGAVAGAEDPETANLLIFFFSVLPPSMQWPTSFRSLQPGASSAIFMTADPGSAASFWTCASTS